MFKKIKKTRGFTLVELIIVIAIVAILAAVGVAGYYVFIDSSSESADIQLVTQLNSILKADEITNGTKETFYEVNTEILEINGIKSTDILAKSRDNYIVWDQENNRFALVNKNTNELIFTDEDTTISQTQIKHKNNFKKSVKYDKWVVVNDENNATAASQTGYSIYLSDNYVGHLDLDIFSGFDAGKVGTTTLNSITYHKYENRTTAQKVVVRTNGGEFNIVTYFDDDNGNVDEFVHYGNCESLDIPDELNESGNFVENGESVEAVKLEKKLKNTTFLYRLGNINAISLNSLFEKLTNNALTGEEADVSIEVLEGNVTCNFTKDLQDILSSTIKFENDGIIKLNFTYKTKTFSQYFEICDAKNCTNYGDLSSNNSGKSVLLNDITMSNGGQLYLYDGACIDGNGFIFDVTNAATSHKNSQGKYIESNSYVISLSGNNIIDNIQIVGKPYNDVNLYAAQENNFPVISVLGENINICNSYISNCFAPIRMRGGSLKVDNTTLCGGAFSNFDIRNGKVTLKDLTTINQAGYTDGGSLGLGITSYYEQVTDCVISIEGFLHQYNWLTSDDTTNMKSVYSREALSEILSTSPYYSTDNGKTFANAGIVCMNKATLINDNSTTKEDYIKSDVSFYGLNGEAYSLKNPNSINFPSNYISSNNLGNSPHCEVNYPVQAGDINYLASTELSKSYCYYNNSNKRIEIGFSVADSFVFNLDIITITKFNKNIIPSSIVVNHNDSNTSIDLNNKNVTFSEEGDYLISYNYEDTFNYRGDLTNYFISYTKIIEIHITTIANQNDAVIKLYDKECTEIDLGNNTILLSGAGDSSSEFSQTTYNNITINVANYNCNAYSSNTNQNTVVTGKVNNKYLHHEILGGFAKIYDYDQNNNEIKVWETKTDDDPDNFSFLSSSLGNKASDAFDWGTKSHDFTKKTFSNKLFYVSNDASNNERVERNFYVYFSYLSNKGKTYIYGVKYHNDYYAKNDGCFTLDTKITLANGTQKEIQYLSKSDQILAYDMYQGKYVPSKIIGLTNHGYGDYDLLKCKFSNGETLKLLEKHGLYDYDLNSYIYIDASNYESYIGHKFVTYTGDMNSYDIVILDSVELSKEYTCAYSIASYKHMSAVTDNILSVTPNIDVTFWIPKKDKLLYDVDALNQILDQYGTYSYDLFKDYLTYEQFIGFNGPLLKAPVEMGLLTFDDLIKMIEDNKEFII